MGQPAAKKGDRITATDTHVELVQVGAGAPTPTPTPHPFNGIIDGGLSSDVIIEGLPAATVGSTATNTPPHIPKSGPFETPPSNRATIRTGSQTVTINGKQAARSGDVAETCNDPKDLPIGRVVATGTVMIGG